MNCLIDRTSSNNGVYLIQSEQYVRQVSNEALIPVSTCVQGSDWRDLNLTHETQFLDDEVCGSAKQTEDMRCSDGKVACMAT